MITIIFEDDVDFYFARQRVRERLAEAGSFLPQGVTPYLAPDATALGQIFWYTVEPDPTHPIDPARLWALNKFYIAPQLNAAPGVAEVATVGGMPLEYQVDVQPEDLRAYGVTLGELFDAVSRSNLPAAGGVIQKNNAEYIVRGVGWIRGQGGHREHGRQGGERHPGLRQDGRDGAARHRSSAAASSRRTATRWSAASC